MSFEAALRATEILFALAVLQQSAEHLVGRRIEQVVFGLRCGLVLGIMAGVPAPLIWGALLATQLWLLHLFEGPYNGGSDRMGGLILICLVAAHWAPVGMWQEAALGYLGVQLVVCYFMSGRVKVVNPDWRSGAALRDVFAFSAYPVSGAMRGWAAHVQILRLGSWAVIGFELAFPLAMISSAGLMVALSIAALFHLANACVFGLNRFFWVWLAAFPSVLWLQTRISAVVW